MHFAGGGGGTKIGRGDQNRQGGTFPAGSDPKKIKLGARPRPARPLPPRQFGQNGDFWAKNGHFWSKNSHFRAFFGQKSKLCTHFLRSSRNVHKMATIGRNMATFGAKMDIFGHFWPKIETLRAFCAPVLLKIGKLRLNFDQRRGDLFRRGGHQNRQGGNHRRGGHFLGGGGAEFY